VYLESYGCTQNLGEARLMADSLRERGHRLAATESDADALVLVTCTVIGHTERRMVRRMRAMAAHGKPLVVAGCMAGAQRALVRRAVPAARLLPPRRWSEIGELIDAGTACAERAVAIEAAPPYADLVLPIAQGCLGSCTYCITRVARGRVTSYSPEALEARVRQAVERGIREIKLTGQDTAAYGRDTGSGLPELLRRLRAIPGEFRIRVGMADPLTVAPIREDLAAAFDDPKVYKFLHLPVQSGDDGLLERMRREHGVADFERIVSGFRARFPDLALSTDLIVGFPGETEASVERTADLLRRVRPDVVNVTRFSPRPGTPAASWEAPHGRQVKAWSRRLTAVKNRIAWADRQRFVGRRVRVLTTEPGKAGTTLARTGEYRQVVLSEVLPLGVFAEAEITAARVADLFGVRRMGTAAEG
jgi:MiaB-like tRNA modifying enzyme